MSSLKKGNKVGYTVVMLKFLRKIIGPNHPVRRGWHFAKALLANLVYGFPARKLICIGVTGTNGKTTTTHMIEHLLSGAGKSVAMMSTVDFALKGKFMRNQSKKTTLSPFKTQKFLKECVKNGVEYVVIESSSHALHQYRLWGIPFQVAVLTNITHEHLDYHGNMHDYKEAKKILFNITAGHKNACLILNTADYYFSEFKKIEAENIIPYGLKKGDLRASHLKASKEGVSFEIDHEGQSIKTSLLLHGDFNVENALAATGVALNCGVSLKKVSELLKGFDGVSGRMERVKSSKGFEVMIDFALTPDALERLYSELKKSHDGRLIGLIGSCGERDQEKRPLMGEIVAKYCDVTIVTDEEPYSEDPIAIMQAILKGAKRVKDYGVGLTLIEDRYQAIEFAVKNAQKNDLIVLTGMGSFDTRTLNHGPIEWNEKEVAEEIIKKYQ